MQALQLLLWILAKHVNRREDLPSEQKELNVAPCQLACSMAAGLLQPDENLSHTINLAGLWSNRMRVIAKTEARLGAGYARRVGEVGLRHLPQPTQGQREALAHELRREEHELLHIWLGQQELVVRCLLRQKLEARGVVPQHARIPRLGEEEPVHKLPHLVSRGERVFFLQHGEPLLCSAL